MKRWATTAAGKMAGFHQAGGPSVASGRYDGCKRELHPTDRHSMLVRVFSPSDGVIHF
jgi:hypothetical protein